MIFSICCPYIATYVTGRLGGSYKIGWYLSGITAAVALILCFFIRNTPQECGQTQDGLVEGETIDINKKPAKMSTVYKRPIGQKSISLKEAQKMPIFWAMLVVAALGFAVKMVDTSFNVHFRSYGISLETISAATAARAILGLVMLIFISSILDKIEPAFIYGVSFILFASGCFLTANMAGAGTWVIYVAFFLYSAMYSCVMTIMPVIYANYFGNEHFPTIQGLSLLAGGLLSSTTGVISGALADKAGGFSFSYMVYGSVALVAAAIIIFVVGIPSASRYKREIAVSTEQ
jgi:Na+/melibiose symporter-like transporter